MDAVGTVFTIILKAERKGGLMVGDLQKLITERTNSVVKLLKEIEYPPEVETAEGNPEGVGPLEDGQVYVVLYFDEKTIREPDGAAINLEIESAISVHSTLEAAKTAAVVQNAKYSILPVEINGAKELIQKI